VHGVSHFDDRFKCFLCDIFHYLFIFILLIQVEGRRVELRKTRGEIEAEAKRVAKQRGEADGAIADARRRGTELSAQMRRAADDARKQEKDLAGKRAAADREAKAVASARAKVDAERVKVQRETATERAKVEQAKAAAKRKEADVDRREAHVARAHRHLAVPRHWTARRSLAASDTSPAARVDMTAALGGAVEKLMNESSVKENGWIVGGRDNPGVKHRAFKVVRVTRIENSRVMRAFSFARDNLAAHKPDTTNVKSYDRGIWRALGQGGDGNEVLLFHACKPEVAPVIAEQGFDERVCGLNGLFGAAVYFAENASKSGEYAVEDPATKTAFMFLSRVALGRPHMRPAGQHLNNQRRPPCLQSGHMNCTHERADSVICVGSARFGYREFMVYDRSQAYPELLIEFRRV
jgi:hypothetical protein